MRKLNLPLTLLAAAVALTTAGLSRAIADGCCAPKAAAPAGHAHAAAPSPAASTTAMEPIPSVLDSYEQIQTALAGDSLKGVAAAAGRISALVGGDSMKMLPAELAAQSEALAKAGDLASARESFKQLSATLIAALERQKVQTGRYYAVHCGMAKASWLQTSKTVKNPYYGSSMAGCGEIKKSI